jgi:hypothetical protein
VNNGDKNMRGYGYFSDEELDNEREELFKQEQLERARKEEQRAACFEEWGYKVARLLEANPDRWQVRYGGAPIQWGRFRVGKDEGRCSFKENHPMQPSDRFWEGWHYKDLAQLCQILGVDFDSLPPCPRG